LLGAPFAGAVGGGVIAYLANGTQNVAAPTALTEIPWPTEIATANVSILGLESRNQ
jgi:alcohol dehydrogenase (cytochrome c)